jgi:hypothetical protein
MFVHPKRNRSFLAFGLAFKVGERPVSSEETHNFMTALGFSGSIVCFSGRHLGKFMPQGMPLDANYFE